jgi:hypothetical protein
MGTSVEVDLGERDILVLQFKHILTAEQRLHVSRAMAQIAAGPGRQTIVLEDGCEYSVIQREAAPSQADRIEAKLTGW